MCDRACAKMLELALSSLSSAPMTALVWFDVLARAPVADRAITSHDDESDDSEDSSESGDTPRRPLAACVARTQQHAHALLLAAGECARVCVHVRSCLDVCRSINCWSHATAWAGLSYSSDVVFS
jgi:hypothetical protein